MALDFDFTPELAEFAHMTIVPGVTVGDLVFVSAQKLWSTGAQAPSTVANSIPSNIAVDLFKVGKGSTGQGFTGSLSYVETNFDDDNGRFGANECFVAHSASFRLYQRSAAALATTETVGVLSPEIINGLIYSCSWTLETADGIKRNMGLLAGYPAAGGIYPLPTLPSAQSTVDLQPSRGGNNGYPSRFARRKLPVPVIFGPNLSNKIQVVNGSGQVVTTGRALNSGSDFDGLTGASARIDGGLPTSAFIIFELVFDGYRFTMPAPAAT